VKDSLKYFLLKETLFINRVSHTDFE